MIDKEKIKKALEEQNRYKWTKQEIDDFDQCIKSGLSYITIHKHGLIQTKNKNQLQARWQNHYKGKEVGNDK